MSESPVDKRDWVLTPDAFEILLVNLHVERERAGEEYERIRQKLLKFFKWRGCHDPEGYADRTIDRVARRIMDGVELRVRDRYLFFHGVALNVLKEHWRGPRRDSDTIDDLPPSLSPADDPAEIREREEGRQEQERRLECLGECLQTLSAEGRELVTKYHQSEGRAKIEGRKELAALLKIPLNALRIRVFRIRTELEGCVEGCLRRLPAG
jgi:DNA-directed RNA polymerase specialized sigma24 family protein